jgi:group I intron endonuclease
MKNNINTFKNKSIIPIFSYPNVKKDQNLIYRNNRYKSGIYCWTNLITNESYVGHSRSLTDRFYTYFSEKSIKSALRKKTNLIYSAILKYGYSNFSLDIIEYCEPNLLRERERYYIDLLQPKYNRLIIKGLKSKFNNIKS